MIAHVRVVAAKGEEGTWGTAAQPILVTQYQLEVLAVGRGAEVGERIDLQLPGGHVGRRGFSISGVPTLEVDDELVVVLDHDRPGHPLVGGEAGLLRVVNHTVSAQGRAVTGIDQGGIHLSAPRSRAPRPVPVGESLPVSVETPSAGLQVDEALSALVALEVTP